MCLDDTCGHFGKNLIIHDGKLLRSSLYYLSTLFPYTSSGLAALLNSKSRKRARLSTTISILARRQFLHRLPCLAVS